MNEEGSTWAMKFPSRRNDQESVCEWCTADVARAGNIDCRTVAT